MYGKRESADFIDKTLNENRVIATHTEKAEQLLHSIGCQSSKENTTISFGDSIAYTTANVNYSVISSKAKKRKIKPYLRILFMILLIFNGISLNESRITLRV